MTSPIQLGPMFCYWQALPHQQQAISQMEALVARYICPEQLQHARLWHSGDSLGGQAAQRNQSLLGDSSLFEPALAFSHWRERGCRPTLAIHCDLLSQSGFKQVVDSRSQPQGFRRL